MFSKTIILDNEDLDNLLSQKFPYSVFSRFSVFRIFGIEKEWNDTPSPEGSNEFRSILGFTYILLAVFAIVNSDISVLGGLVFLGYPLFIIYGFIVDRRHNNEEYALIQYLKEVNNEADVSAAGKDIGDFELATFKLRRSLSKLSKFSYVFSIVKMLKRAHSLGLSEEIYPHLLRTNLSSEEIAESIGTINQALDQNNLEAVALGFANLYGAYIFATLGRANPALPTESFRKGQIINFLETVQNDLINDETGIMKATGRVSKELERLKHVPDTDDSRMAIFVINWLLVKLLELKNIKFKDSHFYWKSRPAWLSDLIEQMKISFSSGNNNHIMRTVVESYDRSILTRK